MFATERDLLVLEPYLFRDHAWVGQRLARGNATIADGSIDFSVVDVELDVAQVASGCVVTVLGSSYEITGNVGTKSASVSRLRPSIGGTTIMVSDTAESDAWIVSFRPQIAMVHRQILRMAGIEPDAPAPIDGRLGESAITNGVALVTLEALGIGGSRPEQTILREALVSFFPSRPDTETELTENLDALKGTDDAPQA